MAQATNKAIRRLFAEICIHYKLCDKLQIRSYMPGDTILHQIVDAEGNPLTEYIPGAEMKHFLKGLGEGLRIKSN